MVVRWDASKYEQLRIQQKHNDHAIKKLEVQKAPDTHELAGLYRKRSRIARQISELLEARGD